MTVNGESGVKATVALAVEETEPDSNTVMLLFLHSMEEYPAQEKIPLSNHAKKTAVLVYFQPYIYHKFLLELTSKNLFLSDLIFKMVYFLS